MNHREASRKLAVQDKALRRAWLTFSDLGAVELNEGVTMVGRGERCHLVLHDPLISRWHACFVLDAQGVLVKDLGSTNGVFVNGQRVEEPRVLVESDRIILGCREARLGFNPPPPTFPFHRRADAVETVRKSGEGARAPQDAMTAPPDGVSLESPQRLSMTDPGPGETTRPGKLLEMLSEVAEKALSSGRGIEAERILARPLTEFLDRARASKAVTRSDAVLASALAVKLARATGKGQWIEYVFRLGTALVWPPPAEVIDEVQATIRSVAQIDRGLFTAYLEVIRAGQKRLDPSERLLIRRLEGLRAALALI